MANVVNKEELQDFLQRFWAMDYNEAIGEFVYKFSQLEFLIKYRPFKSLGDAVGRRLK
jgi:hypothetical protein